MDYYVKEPIILKEYGKVVQKLTQYAVSQEDKDKRTKMAYAIVEFMAQLTPSVKSTEDYRKKLWDHLFFIADYKLDVDAPYEVAEREFIVNTPERLPYPSANNKFRHYGQYIVDVIKEANELDEEKRKIVAGPIASYMKLVHKNWNNEVVNDAIVKNDLFKISEGKLELSEDESIRHLMPKNKYSQNHNQNKRKKKKGKPNKNQNHNRRQRTK